MWVLSIYDLLSIQSKHCEHALYAMILSYYELSEPWRGSNSNDSTTDIALRIIAWSLILEAIKNPTLWLELLTALEIMQLSDETKVHQADVTYCWGAVVKSSTEPLYHTVRWICALNTEGYKCRHARIIHQRLVLIATFNHMIFPISHVRKNSDSEERGVSIIARI